MIDLQNNKSKLIAVAKGAEKASLVFKNAWVLDVFSEQYTKSDVAVCDGVIAGIGTYTGEKEVDLNGKYLIPGLIDSHVHIESSYLTPAMYAEAVMPHGVTTVIADPHEIANVCGEDGIRFMMESAKTVPLDVYFMLPSCVPATPFDSSGAVIDVKKTAELMRNYDFLGLGEMMNYPGVVSADDAVLEKLSAADIIDGHAPGLSGKDLCAYVVSGIQTDHECMTSAEAEEKIRMGMYIHMREGTLAKNVSALSAAVTPSNSDRFTLCTDDKHIDDILAHGTVTDCIRTAVKSGIKPETAVKMATFNAARCYRLYRKGAIAPGYAADLVVCSEDSVGEILAVYKNGICVAEKGVPLFSGESAAEKEKVIGTVNIKTLSEITLTCAFDPGVPAIRTIPGSLLTEKSFEKNSGGLCNIAVIERYRASGNIGRAFVKGLKISGGAVAQTIGHDSHNMIVLGDNERDMKRAVAALGRDGGIAVAGGGEIAAYLPLTIGGIMSDRPLKEIAEEYQKVVAEIEKHSDSGGGEFLMSLAFLSLLVIPKLKLSDKGLFDVEKFDFI